MRALPPTLLLLLSAALPALNTPHAELRTTATAAGAVARVAAESDSVPPDLEGRREALRKAEESAAGRLAAGDGPGAARELNRAGRLRLILNELREALDSHRRALSLLAESPAAEVEVDALNGQAAAYMRLNEKEQAAEVVNRALSLSERIGYVAGRAEALLALSDRENYENHAAALLTAQRSLELWRSLGDGEGLARAHAQIGRCHMAQNALAEAEQSYRQALAIRRDLNDPAGQAEALIMLGFIEYRRAEWENSVRLLTQAQGLIDEHAEPGKMGQIACGLAEAFNEHGLPENGLVHYRRALDYYRRTQAPHLINYATWGLGVTYYQLGNYTEAADHLRQVLAGVEPDSLLAAQSYEYLGRIHSDRGEHGAARRELQAALSIYEKARNPREAAQVRGLLGQLSERQGRFEEARRFYGRSLNAFDALSDRINQAAVYYALGRLELNAGRYDDAEEHLRRSVEITEEIRRAPTSSDLTAAFSATTHERYEKYVECLMRLHEARPTGGFDVRAFQVSELARARSLAEKLRATRSDFAPGVPPELAARVKALRQARRTKEDSRIALLSRPYEKEELAALDSELARLGAEYRQVSEAIRERHPVYDQLVRPRAWDLRQVQQEVVADDRTILLEYGLGETRSYVWAVTRDGFTGHELPARAVVEAAAERVYRLLSAPPAPEAAETLEAAVGELSRAVLSPVAAELSAGRRVIVVADGALNYIPFQILTPPGRDEPLVAGHEITYSPSASVVGELRREASRRRAAPKLLAAFGNPVFASNYAQREEAQGGAELAAVQALDADRPRHAPRHIEINRDTFDPSLIRPLFYAKRELAYLLDATGGGGSFVAEGFAATRERLLGTDLTQYSILHFATHGLLDPKQPENSGLVLSTIGLDGREQDGFVGLQNIYELRAPVSLVVLSACQTALGKDVRGEGLLGLTRGFMYAGASSVVASLWKVDDEVTAELMRHFYANMLREGATPAAALRAAQNSIRQRPEWQSPYYWAAFTLNGEYRQVIKPAGAGAGAKLLAGGTLLTLLAGAGLWSLGRRRRSSGGFHSTAKK